MRWLGRLLGFVLALCLVVTTQAWILDRTVWNLDYLNQQIKSAHLADSLAAALPEVMSQVTGESEQTKLAVKEAVTPQYIQTQFDTVLPQILNYLRLNGVPPILDLRDLEPVITNAGLPMPEKLDSIIANPSVLSLGQFDGVLKQAALRTQQILWLGPLAVIILTLIMFFILGRHRWSVYAGSLAFAALLLGVIGLVDYSPPQLVSSALETSAGKALAPALAPFMTSIALDQTHASWIAAAVLFGMSVVCVFIGLIAKTIGGHHKKDKS